MGDATYTEIESDEKYELVETTYPLKHKADVLEVRLLGIEREIGPHRGPTREQLEQFGIKEEKIERVIARYEKSKDVLKVTVNLGIDCVLGSGQIVKDIECVCSQGSLESSLNDTDLYFVVNAEYPDKDPTCAYAGMYGKSIKMQFERRYSLCQGEQQGENSVRSDEDYVYHLSFFSRNSWKMYRLDMRNPEEITFEFVENYLYIQGKAIKSERGCLAEYRIKKEEVEK